MSLWVLPYTRVIKGDAVCLSEEPGRHDQARHFSRQNGRRSHAGRAVGNQRGNCARQKQAEDSCGVDEARACPCLHRRSAPCLTVFADAGLHRQARACRHSGLSVLLARRRRRLARVGDDARKIADLATASLAISSIDANDTMETILRRADATFAAVPGLDPKSLPSHFRSANGFVVDLLTPQLRRTDPNPLPLEKLKAGAAPLQHLRWLIDSPIPAAALFGSGVPVMVPTPARFAVHKLIVAQKRTHDRGKRGKDLLQAEALIEALRTIDPWGLADAYDGCLRGRKKRLEKSGRPVVART